MYTVRRGAQSKNPPNTYTFPLNPVAQHAPRAREDQRLHEELNAEAPAGRAQGEPDRDLVGALQLPGDAPPPKTPYP